MHAFYKVMHQRFIKNLLLYLGSINLATLIWANDKSTTFFLLLAGFICIFSSGPIGLASLNANYFPKNIEWILRLPQKKMKTFRQHGLIQILLMLESIILGIVSFSIQIIILGLYHKIPYQELFSSETFSLPINVVLNWLRTTEHLSILCLILIGICSIIFTYHDKHFGLQHLLGQIKSKNSRKAIIALMSTPILLLILPSILQFKVAHYYYYFICIFFTMMLYVVRNTIVLRIPIRMGQNMLTSILLTVCPIVLLLISGVYNFKIKPLPAHLMVKEAVYFAQLDQELTNKLAKELLKNPDSKEAKKEFKAFEDLYFHSKRLGLNFPTLREIGIEDYKFIEIFSKRNNLLLFHQYLKIDGQLELSKNLIPYLDNLVVLNTLIEFPMNKDDYNQYIIHSNRKARHFALAKAYSSMRPKDFLYFLKNNIHHLPFEDYRVTAEYLSYASGQTIPLTQIGMLYTNNQKKWKELEDHINSISWDNDCHQLTEESKKYIKNKNVLITDQWFDSDETKNWMQNPLLVYCANQIYSKYRHLKKSSDPGLRNIAKDIRPIILPFRFSEYKRNIFMNLFVMAKNNHLIN